LASSGDNLQLIELTASTGMMGETSLRIDRKPDFFKLLEKRGKTTVFVAVEDNRIVGSLCVSLQEVYVGGQVLPLHYIGDFKVAASHRKMGIGLRLCDELANCIIPEGADLAFLNVAKGNKQPYSNIKNRTNIPDFENIGIFKIHQFIGKRTTVTHPLYKIEESPVSEELLKFLNGYYGKYELGAVITKENWKRVSIFIIKNENHIIAAMCLADTMAFKQNVVIKLSWKFKYLLKFLTGPGEFRFSKMPLTNEPVRLIYIKYLAVNDLQKQLVKSLINHARNIAFENLIPSASIGLHEKDLCTIAFPVFSN
jgi:hypothetical protein